MRASVASIELEDDRGAVSFRTEDGVPSRMSPMSYPELGTRTAEIRNRLAAAGAVLNPGEGLAQALTQAEVVARNNGPVRGIPQHEFLANARACTAMWDLAGMLRTCDTRGLNMTAHLRNITTGTVDFGVPAAPNSQSHYFKDFQLELYVAAQCITDNVPQVALNPVPNAPDGDLYLETLRCEIKHPNSLGQLSDYLKKFNKALQDRNLYGVFVTGIEDMFSVFPPEMFPDDAAFQAWLTQKRQEADFYARTFFRMAAGRDRILATVQLWSFWYQAGGAVSLHREGNAIAFDHRAGIPAQQQQDAERIARVFNPHFRRWTQIETAVQNLISDSERTRLRESLHKKAYQIWQGEGEPREGRALANWLQAKSDYGLVLNTTF
jgi:hypothetical protein